ADWLFVGEGVFGAPIVHRQAYFHGIGSVETPVLRLDGMEPGRMFGGPVIVESPVTTVVVDAGATVSRSAAGSLLIHPHGRLEPATDSAAVTTAGPSRE